LKIHIQTTASQKLTRQKTTSYFVPPIFDYSAWFTKIEHLLVLPQLNPQFNARSPISMTKY